MQPCRQSECPELVERGYCARHRPKARPVRTGRAVYNSKKWKIRSRAFLVRYPLCVECGKLADQVDHIRDIHSRPDLIWDEANWQPLCRKDHGKKTAKEVRERRH